MTTLSEYSIGMQSMQNSLVDFSGQNAGPVFIVSSGRSGTTLLRAMLNAGGEIMFPHESDFIARAYPFFGHGELDPRDYALLICFFVTCSQKEGWGMPEARLFDDVSRLAPKTLAEFIQVLHQAYHQQLQLNPSRWGNKTPVLIASLDRIFSVFPNAQVVHLVRDGRDVFLSYRAIHRSDAAASFGPNGSVLTALYWVDGLRRIDQYADRVYELRYEDLLDRPSEALRQLCARLGIHFSAAMVDNYLNSPANRDVVLDSHKETIHAKLLQGLDRTNAAKYMTRMTRWQRFRFEAFAAPYLRKYGYVIEFPIAGSWLFAPLRELSYVIARLHNVLRYRARDQATFLRAKRALLSAQWSPPSI